MLNRDGIKSDLGTIRGSHEAAGMLATYDYGNDFNRNGVLTFHNRSNCSFSQNFKYIQ